MPGVRILLVVLALAAAARAQDAYKEWKDAHRSVTKDEKRFWREFQGRYREALLAFDKPWEAAQADPKAAINYVWDYSGLRLLYADFEALQRRKGEADVAFAKTQHPRAFDALLDELFRIAKRIDAIEADLLDAKPKSGYHFDARPPVERHGLATHLDLMVEALAQCPDAAASLEGEGWQKALKKDGKRSVVRRVAVADALGWRGSPKAHAALVRILLEKESSVRVAATEALLRFSKEGPEAIVGRLTDPSFAVRRALLQGIRGKPDDPRWIQPVLESYGRSFGVLRNDHVLALEALTNQKFGDDVERWKSWYEDYAKEIAGGGFDREKIEIREVPRKKVPATCEFYGVRMPGRGFVFVVEGSRRIWWPANLDAMLKEYKETWHGRRKTWEAEHPSHQTVLLRNFEKTSGAWPDTISFGLVALHSRFGVDVLGEKELLRPSRRDLKEAHKVLEKLPGRGYCSQLAGLMAAAELAGMGPEGFDFAWPKATTIVLWNSGSPYGGRYLTPEAVLAAFARFNRFRRFVVHTIRICDEGEPSETLMKGLAEQTGGTYLWARN